MFQLCSRVSAHPTLHSSSKDMSLSIQHVTGADPICKVLSTFNSSSQWFKFSPSRSGCNSTEYNGIDTHLTQGVSLPPKRARGARPLMNFCQQERFDNWDCAERALPVRYNSNSQSAVFTAGRLPQSRQCMYKSKGAEEHAAQQAAAPNYHCIKHSKPIDLGNLPGMAQLFHLLHVTYMQKVI